MGLANNFKDLDKFVDKMKSKLIAVEHKHKEDSLDKDEIKAHLIEEVLELFEQRDTSNGDIIRKILKYSPLKTDETIDVANMCFALEYIDMQDSVSKV